MRVKPKGAGRGGAKTGAPGGEQAKDGGSAGYDADICLIVEGAYPYVSGGVSGWVQDLMEAFPEYAFHVVTLLPDDTPVAPKYARPANAVGMSKVFLHGMPDGAKPTRQARRVMAELEGPLSDVFTGGGLGEIEAVMAALRRLPGTPGREVLLNSEMSWDLLCAVYSKMLGHSSFINFFWSWRALVGGLFAVLTAPLPRAKVYHTISTGYAGLLAARAKIETGGAVALTEHGIYTNERRIEIVMADWLEAGTDASFAVSEYYRDLKSVWIKVFESYAKACYEAADAIITLYQGNQELQRLDGAPDEKMQVIANGIDFERYSKVAREMGARPVVGFIGRIVPIKDVKTFLHTCAMVRDRGVAFDAMVLGPTDEDPEYYRECRDLVEYLELEDIVTFHGKVQIVDYMGRIDVVVLTSLSEAQPLVILEAGAAGIPAVVTDVGCCRELIHGRTDEVPNLGDAGVVTPVASPAATAAGIVELLQDEARWQACSTAMQARVERYYDHRQARRAYLTLYESLGVGAPARLGQGTVAAVAAGA